MRTASELAKMFAAYVRFNADGDGSVQLTRKQTSWLRDVHYRETGFADNPTYGSGWSLNKRRNGSAVLWVRQEAS